MQIKIESTIGDQAGTFDVKVIYTEGEISVNRILHFHTTTVI